MSKARVRPLIPSDVLAWRDVGIYRVEVIASLFGGEYVYRVTTERETPGGYLARWEVALNYDSDTARIPGAVFAAGHRLVLQVRAGTWTPPPVQPALF